jgi:hypothetical protein
MPLNPDQVRVDLLRIKRKLYISYPEGSKERRDFLLATKLNELHYLQKMVAPDLIDMVFEEYTRQQKAEAINIATGLLSGACLTVMLFGYHQLYPQNVWLTLYPFPAILGLFYSATHIIHVVKHWKVIQPFKKEYATLSGKIAKLLKEIADISKK